MKKTVTALDLLASAVEMRQLAGSRVENIYKTGAGFLFKFSPGYVAVTKYRASLTGVVPEKTHEGAETLRGLFRGDKLLDVFMPRFDRLIELRFETGTLVVELLEPFNVVAVRDGKIVWLMHSYRGRDRELRPGLPYVYPPAVFIDVLKAGVEEIARAIDPGDMRRSLIRRVGTGPELADELLARAGGDPAAIAAELRKIIDDVASGRVEPSVCVKNGVAVSVLPIKPLALQCDEVKRFDKFWAALDFYFVPLETEAAAAGAAQGLDQRKKRLEVTIKELEQKIPEYKKEAAAIKTLAHKLLMYKVEIEEALSGRESSIRILHVNNIVKIQLPEGAEVELKKGVSIGRQISELFERAKELEEKAAKASEVLQKLKAELVKVEEERKKVEERLRSAAKVVAEKKWFEKFHWTITTGKKPVIGGRDAAQNEAVVRRYLKDHYLFFHADIPGASAVATPPLDDPLEVLQAAQFAAAYSKAWKIGIHTIDVYYVKGEQVSKQPPSGQYLARGSFMIYGKREYVRNVRLELALGCRKDGEVHRVVAAPPRSIHLLAEQYVVLTPGNVEKSRLAKDLAGRWAGCPLDDITAAIPGPSRVTEQGRGIPLSWQEVEQIFQAW
ncbi:MAG: ribosome rescue protein RqcH [Pyrobaculum sp.]